MNQNGGNLTSNLTDWQASSNGRFLAFCYFGDLFVWDWDNPAASAIDERIWHPESSSVSDDGHLVAASS